MDTFDFDEAMRIVEAHERDGRPQEQRRAMLRRIADLEAEIEQLHGHRVLAWTAEQVIDEMGRLEQEVERLRSLLSETQTERTVAQDEAWRGDWAKRVREAVGGEVGI